MKVLSLLAAASVALLIGAEDVSASEVLSGKALEKKLTNTQLTLTPRGRKLRKGDPTRYIIKLLPTGESTWETNGSYARETLVHWRIRGNLICFEDANKRFRDQRRRDRGEKIRKRGKYDNCSVMGIKGDRITIYAPQGSSNRNWVLTGRFKSIWP